MLLRVERWLDIVEFMDKVYQAMPVKKTSKNTGRCVKLICRSDFKTIFM